MNRTHALLFVIAGLLVLAVLSPLYVRQLLAAPPAEPLLQGTVTGEVCPLSDRQEQSSEQAFAPIAVVFTGQPRCVNCHGAVDPFAENAPLTHGGGKLKKADPVFKAQPNSQPGVPDQTTVEDTDATLAQCQQCHSAFPGQWMLPPPGLLFVGKDAPTLCKQEKDFFNRDGGGRFLNHITHDDNPDNPFIQEAFKGTRGLNAEGQDRATDPYPDPPKGVTHEQLIQMAQDWLNATGGRWKGDPECGCTAHHYALQIATQTIAAQTVGGVPLRVELTTQAQLPFTFADDGSFKGEAQVQGQEKFSGTVNGDQCEGTAPIATHWSMSGTVDDRQQTMQVKLKFSTAATTVPFTCPRGGGNTIPAGGIDSSAYPSALDKVELPSLTGPSRTLQFTILNGKTTASVTLVQTD